MVNQSLNLRLRFERVFLFVSYVNKKKIFLMYRRSVMSQSIKLFTIKTTTTTMVQRTNIRKTLIHQKLIPSSIHNVIKLILWKNVIFFNKVLVFAPHPR